MEIKWLIILLSIPISAALLAFKSMEDFQDKPDRRVENGLFLVCSVVNIEDIQKIIHLLNLRSLKRKINPVLISFEILMKGTSKSLVLFGPKNLVQELNYLKLIELEDYCLKMDQSKLHCFEIGRRNKPDKKVAAPADFNENIHLNEDEYLFTQIIASKDTGLIPSKGVQVSMRVVVAAFDSSKRLDLAKTFEKLLLDKFNLSRVKRQIPSVKIFENYQGRSLIPAEVKRFILNASDLCEILKQV